jgi:lipid II:glycine glycyltransferase (peptidoglycan interpeptide bridge formation enzyme)
VYAFSWYLDIVANNWDVLVLDDYKAVMPIPWKQKYFIKYVTQPYFCQQLGVFSTERTTLNLQNSFLKKIPSKYVKVTQNLNSENLWNKNTAKRKNYILSLSGHYEGIFKNFSRTRKQRVKVGFKNGLIIKDAVLEDLIQIQKDFYSYQDFSSDILLALSNYVLHNNKGKILGVFKDKKLLGGGLFLKTEQRIIYLFSSFNTAGREYQAASFLINYVIEKNQKNEIIFDFEGGNIPSIGSFFKSFGAKPEIFHQYSRNFY